jgi:hypothetical protein
MHVRISRKLADRMDGIDLSHCAAGDVIDLAEREARMIVAEGWAVFARRAADLMATRPDETFTSGLAGGRRSNGDRRRSSRAADLYQTLAR